MSYCRWSSDDFQCDVYVYEDVSGGFTTHVKAGRPVPDETLPLPIPQDAWTVEAWMARHEKVIEWVAGAKHELIRLPFDGKEFNDPTAADCADRLEWLRGLGYNVPQYAIDALREEAEEDEE